VVASPVAGHGLVVAANSYDWQAMLAIRLEGAQGDVTDSDQVAWSLNRLTPYVPSPLLVGKRLYFLRHLQGILSCVDLETGEVSHGPWRLPVVRMVFASPVAAAGRIYITSREGITLVFDHPQEEDMRLIAVNRLDDTFSASPALVGEQLILRGERFLYSLKAASEP
jgi:outer membrane protein assembly factor BamB